MQNIKGIFLSITLLLIIALIPATSKSQDLSAKSKSSFKITANAGLFIPARTKMVKLYGTSVNTLGSIEYRISSKLYLGVYAGYIELEKGTLYLKYRNIYFGPLATYLISEKIRYSIYGQLGLGLNIRKIHAYTNAYKQNDFGPSLNLGLGANYTIFDPVFLGGKVIFDYIYDANPDQGDFGNTGGFNFLINVGVTF